MIIYQPPKAATSIPVIDFAPALSGDPAARRAVAWEIHKACRETGFFYIVGHGVPEALMQGQLDAARDFFALPLEQKLDLHMNKSPARRGYEPIAAQTLDEGAPPDLKESLMLGREPIDADDLAHGAAPNPWPENLAGFREQNQAYEAAVTALGRTLAATLALSLELPEDYFADGLERANVTVRLLRYPPQAENAEFNQLGSGAHTDWGMLTILLQDDIGGLEVRNVQGDWIRADPKPGAFIINLGDMIPAVTAGLYTSNFHRVLNNASGRDRYSVATFFNPSQLYEFDVAPSCRAPDHQPQVQTFGDHINRMFEKTYASAAQGR